MGKPNKNNFNNKKSSGKKIPSARKKGLEDHAFCTGNKQASDYEVTVKCMLNQIKKTHECGNDTSESLIKLKKVKTSAWEPTLEDSTKIDPDQK